MSKSIMILGAGIYQVPLIRKAKEMEYDTHVVSIKGDYPGIKESDFFYPIDTTETDEIVNLIKKLNIDGIVTTGTDVCIPTLGKVNDLFGFKGPNFQSSVATTDKAIMKTLLLENKVATADFHIVENIEDARKAFKSINKPCAVKSPDSSGSRGITRVVKEENLEDAFNDSIANSRTGKIIIEEWLEGEEFGAQAVIYNGKLELVMIHSDVVTDPPRSIPVGHGCPHNLNENLKLEVENLIQSAIDALLIDNCISNVDLIYTDAGVKIIEIGARMGATCIPEVCGSWWNVDLYEAVIKIATSQELILPKKPLGRPSFAHILWSDKSGTIENMRDLSGDLKWSIDKKIGDNVEAFTSGNKRIGQVIGEGNEIHKIESYVIKYAEAFNNEISLR